MAAAERAQQAASGVAAQQLFTIGVNQADGAVGGVVVGCAHVAVGHAAHQLGEVALRIIKEPLLVGDASADVVDGCHKAGLVIHHGAAADGVAPFGKLRVRAGVGVVVVRRTLCAVGVALCCQPIQAIITQRGHRALGINLVDEVAQGIVFVLPDAHVRIIHADLAVEDVVGDGGLVASGIGDADQIVATVIGVGRSGARIGAGQRAIGSVAVEGGLAQRVAICIVADAALQVASISRPGAGAGQVGQLAVGDERAVIGRRCLPIVDGAAHGDTLARAVEGLAPGWAEEPLGWMLEVATLALAEEAAISGVDALLDAVAPAINRAGAAAVETAS